VVTKPCTSCHGEGRVRKERTIELKIPAGVGDGTRLRIAGQGEAGDASAVPGDLYVVIHVKEHPVFTRRDDHIICQVGITFSQAALGTTLKVPTLYGEEEMEVPPGVQSGTVFRLRGKGLPAISGRGRGDQFATVLVHTPEHLQPEQRKLFEELAEFEGEEVSGRGIFERVRDIFN
jgi:molecular chaperone DnaJ